MSYSDAELAGALGSEDVTPEEYGSFPHAVYRGIHETGGVPGDLDELVAVARMVNVLQKLAPERDDPSSVVSPQAELFPREARVDARIPGHEPMGDRRTPGGRMAQPRKSGGFWDEWGGSGYEDESDLWLYPAEEWLDEDFKSDPDDDAYVGPWFIHRFTPELATEWWEAGIVDGELAHELRRRRVTLEMLAKVVIEPAMREFENLKEAARRRWARTPTETDEAKAASERRLKDDYRRFTTAVADDIAHLIDGVGIRRNPKRTSKRTSRRR
jgi:hypothetical protein